MKFFELMSKWYKAINWWMTDHPWQTILYGAAFVVLFVWAFHHIPVLAVYLLAAYMIPMLIIMLGDAVWTVKSGYKPDFCDKCGHVLPEKRPNDPQ